LAANEENDIFKGLRALSESTFPKRCANCGNEYATVQDYVQKTEDVSGKTGLKKGYDDNDQPIVELFRNCVCGSTLMDCFSDRRDISSQGLKRRELFGKLLSLLESKGVKSHVAREQLLMVLHGQPSKLLERMGINTQVI
jgi:hypothetical protein